MKKRLSQGDLCVCKQKGNKTSASNVQCRIFKCQRFRSLRLVRPERENKPGSDAERDEFLNKQEILMLSSWGREFQFWPVCWSWTSEGLFRRSPCGGGEAENTNPPTTLQLRRLSSLSTAQRKSHECPIASEVHRMWHQQQQQQLKLLQLSPAWVTTSQLSCTVIAASLRQCGVCLFTYEAIAFDLCKVK